jgi:hypothetical protein
MTQFYNLDAVISVGYRVNSIRATQFRQWATSVLREYAIRGYVLDRKRMENGTFLDEDFSPSAKIRCGVADFENVKKKRRVFSKVSTDHPLPRLAVRRAKTSLGSSSFIHT